MGQTASKKKLASTKSPLEFEDSRRHSLTIHYHNQEGVAVAPQFATEHPGQKIVGDDTAELMAVTRPRRLTQKFKTRNMDEMAKPGAKKEPRSKPSGTNARVSSVTPFKASNALEEAITATEHNHSGN